MHTSKRCRKVGAGWGMQVGRKKRTAIQSFNREAQVPSIRLSVKAVSCDD